MALSEDTIRQQFDSGPMPGTLTAHMTTGATFYKGSLICTDTSTGYDVVGVASTTLVPLGVYDGDEITNSGASGSVKVTVKPGVRRFTNSSGDAIAITQRGQKCYIEDDDTVAATSAVGTLSEAGTVIDVDTAGVWVCVGPYPVPGSTYVTLTGIQTLTNKTLTSPTLTTPTIAATGFANATHAHAAANSGGQITPAAAFAAAVPATLGGTGQTTLAQGDVLYASAVDTISKLAKGTANQQLCMNAGATVPAWGNRGSFVSAAAPAFAANDCAITPDPGTIYILDTTAGASTVTITTTSLAAGDMIGFTADGTVNGHTVTYVDGVTTISSAKTASKRHAVMMVFDGTNLCIVGEISP